MRTHLLFIALVLLIAGPVKAGAESVHNHDPLLVGKWFGSTADGSLTALTLEAGGKFILDQRAGDSIQRTYMCGTWERAGSAIEVDIQASKTRFSDGDIVDDVARSDGQFQVLKTTRNSLVLRIDQKVIALHRS